jgi:hypothetical protein
MLSGASRWVPILIGVLGTSVALASCSSHRSPTVTKSSEAKVTTTSSTPSTTTSPLTTTTASAPVVMQTVPMQTPTEGASYSPSGNINCEIDFSSTLQQVFCESIAPPQSVKMTVDGTLTKCSGEMCLGNAGVNTPTLAYGTETGVGPFRCVSATSGVTCTAERGTGFEISNSGVQQVGG